MKIQYVTLQSMAEGQAGHTHVSEIVSGLRSRGHTVDVHGVSYKSSDPSIIVRLITMATTQLRAMLQLPCYDAVYLRSHTLSLPTAVASRLFRKPLVYEVNGTYSDALASWPGLGRLSRILPITARVQLKMATSVVVVTPKLANWVKGMATDAKVTVISNGANVEKFKPTERRSREPYVVFFGALSVWQGIATFLDAAASQEWPDGVRLLIAGDGPLRGIVEHAVVQNGSIEYLGSVPYDEVGPLVSASLASLVLKEGKFEESGLSPLKLYESMAAGVPIVVTSHPDLAAIVERFRNGRVVDTGASRDLALAIREIHQGGVEREALVRARNWIRDSQSWASRATETEQVLVDAIFKPSKQRIRKGNA